MHIHVCVCNYRNSGWLSWGLLGDCQRRPISLGCGYQWWCWSWPFPFLRLWTLWCWKLEPKCVASSFPIFAHLYLVVLCFSASSPKGKGLYLPLLHVILFLGQGLFLVPSLTFLACYTAMPPLLPSCWVFFCLHVFLYVICANMPSFSKSLELHVICVFCV